MEKELIMYAFQILISSLLFFVFYLIVIVFIHL